MRRLLALLLALGLLAACAGTDAGSEPDATAQAEPDPDPAPDPAPDPDPALDIVVTVAPVADLVATVGGDRVVVSSLVPAGVDSHTYEPRPSDVARLETVDAYLGIGLALNDAALRLAEQHVGDQAPVLRLGELALDDGQLVLDHAPHDHGHDHGDDDGHDHDHGDGSAELGPNPHVWTSVRNAATLVDTIAQVLAELDPDGSEVYAANAAGFRAELEALDDAIGAAVATIPPDNRTLVAYHDAWTYFARDYGLDFATAVQPSDYAEPSAAEVRAVIDLITERGVTAVFGAEEFADRVLDTIADETGAVYVGTLADDVLPGEPGSPEHTYLELMRRNATTIVDALGGDAAVLSLR